MATSGTPDIRMELFTCRATAEWHPRVLSQIHNHLEVRRMMLNSEAAAFFRNISDLFHCYHCKALRYWWTLGWSKGKGVNAPCHTWEEALPYTSFLGSLSNVNKETQKQIDPHHPHRNEGTAPEVWCCLMQQDSSVLIKAEWLLTSSSLWCPSHASEKKPISSLGVGECLTGGFLRALSHEPLSLFKQNSTLLPGTEVIVWGRLGSPLVNILFRTKLLSLVPLSWDTHCVLTLWLTLPLVLLVMVAVRLVFWSLSFPKEVSYTTAYIYS